MAINFKRLEDISRALKPKLQNGRTFHTTFVYHGNKLLAIGVNDHTKEHRRKLFGKYQPTKESDGEYIPGIHSEISSLIKLGLEDCGHLTFVNLRIDNNGDPAMSKPCLNCLGVMENISFKKFWYFDGNNYVLL